MLLDGPSTPPRWRTETCCWMVPLPLHAGALFHFDATSAEGASIRMPAERQAWVPSVHLAAWLHVGASPYVHVFRCCARSFDSDRGQFRMTSCRSASTSRGRVRLSRCPWPSGVGLVAGSESESWRVRTLRPRGCRRSGKLGKECGRRRSWRGPSMPM